MTDPGPSHPPAGTEGPEGGEVPPGGLPGPPRNRTVRFAWGAMVVILVGMIALVIYALARPPVTQQVAHPALTSSAVVTALAKVPPAVFDTVGVSSPMDQLVPPTIVSGQPPLKASGKPEVLFVGAEFCPFCGSERWPLIVALSRFGHFTDLSNMQSSSSSVFPGIQTFSFIHSTYASRYVTFDGIELFSDAVAPNGTFTRIARLSPGEAALVTRYGSATGTGTSSGSAPFVDIDNLAVTSTSGFSPAVLLGQSQSEITSELSQPDDPTGQAVVASANYLTAGICAATGQRPSSVCTSKGVRVAAADLGFGSH